jgi:anti-sigma factor RsiW
MSKQHLTTDDLERYCLGMVTASEELAKLEEHLLACPVCVQRAEHAEDYVAVVQAALRSTGSR